MDIEQLIQQLDQTHPGWDIYRAAAGHWCLTVQNSGQRFVATAPAMAEAFAQAIAWVPLPLVPVKPQVFSADDFSIIKCGSKWEIRHRGSFFSGNYPTKKLATQRMNQTLENYENAAQDWEEEWGWVKHKTEGVDFRFTKF
jgi:hypothetical protein